MIDINFYPTEETRKSNLTHRPVGMGSMGWHDMYYALDVEFDSDEATKLSSDVYEFISHAAIEASCELAKERGKYDSYDGSLWSKNIFPMDTYKEVMKSRDHRALSRTNQQGGINWDTLRDKVSKHGMRNSNTMAIAPTATISSIIGASPSIEPYFSVLYVYSTLSGEFTMVNEHFVNDMKKLGKWNENLVDELKRSDGDVSAIDVVPEEIKTKYKTAFQQDQMKMIDQAGARQRWIDQGQSLNLYNQETSLKFLNDLYFHAWNSGLKTTYYLRNKGASSIEKSTVSKVSEPDTPEIENISACSINRSRV